MYEHEFTRSRDVSLYFSENGGKRYLASLWEIVNPPYFNECLSVRRISIQCLSPFIINSSDHGTHTNMDEYEITKSIDVLFISI